MKIPEGMEPIVLRLLHHSYVDVHKREDGSARLVVDGDAELSQEEQVLVDAWLDEVFADEDS